MKSFSERLSDTVIHVDTPLCVGIDPWPERLPGTGPLAERTLRFGRAVIEACAGRVAAVKPQFAFFEAMGPDGMSVLAEVCCTARDAGLLVIGDAKRGDIGSTAAAYAAATIGPDAPFPCDALTVSPFLGPESLAPFVEAAERNRAGLFVLLRTSNPGAARWQAPIEADLAGWIRGQGIGAVVGATHGEDVSRIRALLPDSWLLVPGYGAQGASVADARRALRKDGLGALIASARGATFPDVWRGEPAEWIASRVGEVIGELRG